MNGEIRLGTEPLKDAPFPVRLGAEIGRYRDAVRRFLWRRERDQMPFSRMRIEGGIIVFFERAVGDPNPIYPDQCP